MTPEEPDKPLRSPQNASGRKSDKLDNYKAVVSLISETTALTLILWFAFRILDTFVNFLSRLFDTIRI